MLNKRLDMIDMHCQQFTKLATEKTIMEDNLKNLAYLNAQSNLQNQQQQPQHSQQSEEEQCNNQNIEAPSFSDINGRVDEHYIGGNYDNEHFIADDKAEQDDSKYETRVRQMVH